MNTFVHKNNLIIIILFATRDFPSLLEYHERDVARYQGTVGVPGQNVRIIRVIFRYYTS